MHLLKAMQEEWNTACREELEALRRCNIFKLTDLPKGHKTIGCRWVFDVDMLVACIDTGACNSSDLPLINITEIMSI